MSKDANYQNPEMAIEQGQLGSETLVGGGDIDTATLPFTRLQIINDAVFTTLTNPGDLNSGALEGPTIYAGTVLFGYFTAAVIDSGLAICYR